jgi:hypothetical protein
MLDQLHELRSTLITGIQLSKQGSYHRRAPAEAALPFLNKALAGLREYVSNNSGDVEGWRLLSQAEECMLNFGNALACLEKAMALSPARQKSDFKRLALLKDSIDYWKTIILSAVQLRQLGNFLLKKGVEDPAVGNSLRFCNEWLMENRVEDSEKIIKGFGEKGAYTDFQVLRNIIMG